jgi:hypothetical protein
MKLLRHGILMCILIRYSFAINLKNSYIIGHCRSQFRVQQTIAKRQIEVANLFEKLIDHCCVRSHHPMTRKNHIPSLLMVNVSNTGFRRRRLAGMRSSQARRCRRPEPCSVKPITPYQNRSSPTPRRLTGPSQPQRCRSSTTSCKR